MLYLAASQRDNAENDSQWIATIHRCAPTLTLSILSPRRLALTTKPEEILLLPLRPLLLALPFVALASPAALFQARPADDNATRYLRTLHASNTLPAQDTTGRALYMLACASCHGAAGDGEGRSASLQVPVPDFTDCSFSSREPDADWIAVAHEGGPVRGFDPAMPSFSDAFTVDQLQSVMDYIRTLCGDASWPRGELNLPRAQFTEKAYPEDEAVTTVTAQLEGPGRVANALLYEKRFGSRNQFEIEVPFGAAQPGSGADWEAGLGDIALGLKRTMWHSFERGSIFALGLETVLPTGKESAGLGSGTVVFEPYASFGQILAGSGFVQLQGGVEIPADEDKAEREAFWRGAAGWTFAEDRGFGRTWTPIVELLGARDLESGATVAWDFVPQLQVSLNTRQHVLANIGVRLPLTDSDVRSSTFVFYLLWDWFDGGLFDGW